MRWCGIATRSREAVRPARGRRCAARAPRRASERRCRRSRPSPREYEARPRRRRVRARKALSGFAHHRHTREARMKFERILYETRGDIALLTLNRPDKLNAWTPAMAEEQAAAIEMAND